jgi:predicted nucleotidyltransferase
MRRIRSSGSARSICLDRESLLTLLREVSGKALLAFPELVEVRLIGSLASGTQTGTSDIDLFLCLETLPAHPVEGMKPYYEFFSRRLEMALDILLGTPGREAADERLLAGSLLLAGRPGPARP